MTTTNNPTNNQIGTGATDTFHSHLRSQSGLWDRFDDQTDQFGMYNFPGDPNGNVTANTGSFCLDTANGRIYIKQSDSNNLNWVILGSGGSGTLVNSSQTVTTSGATSSVRLPFDTSTPLISEGASFMTHSHTPLDSSNILIVDFSCWGASGTNTTLNAALFNQNTSTAMAAGSFATNASNGSSNFNAVFLRGSQTAGGTSPITFEVRFGGNSTNTVAMNQNIGGTGTFGTAGIGTLRVWEVRP